MNVTNIQLRLGILKRIFSLLRPLLFAAALIFIVKYILDNQQAIAQQFSTSPNWILLGQSLLCAIGASVFFALKIRQFFLVFGISFPIKDVFVIYCRSMLLTILPGGVWNHLSLGGELYSLYKNCTLRQMSLLIVLMTGIDILGVLLFIPFLTTGWISVPIAVGLTSIIGLIIFASVKIGARIGHLENAIRLKHLVITVLLLCCHWMFMGTAFTVMLLAFHQPIPLFTTNVAIYNLAWLAGFLALPVPSGIGVREFVLQQLYNWIETGIVFGAVFSIIFRVIIIIRDLLLVSLNTILMPRMPDDSARKMNVPT